jgi:hypothetical protein
MAYVLRGPECRQLHCRCLVAGLSNYFGGLQYQIRTRSLAMHVQHRYPQLNKCVQAVDM